MPSTDTPDGYVVLQLTQDSSRWHRVDLGNGVCAVPGAECVPVDQGEGVADGRWPLYEVDSLLQAGQCGSTVRFNMLRNARTNGIRL